MKKVSVIISVYNVEKYIDDCLKSVCSQTYTNLEIILIYDASTDSSLLKCQKWAEKDLRVRLLISQERKGLGAARNRGLRAATGEYIVYMDSDDWIEKDYIEVLYKAIEQAHADYVSSVGFYRVKQEGEVEKDRFLPSGDYNSDEKKALVLLRDAPAVWKKIYNREWVLKNCLFQPELFHYEDWGFDIALVLRARKVTLISKLGVYYRMGREGCLSNDNLTSLCDDFKNSIEFGLEQVEHADLLDRYRFTIQMYLIKDYVIRKEAALAANNQKALQILEQIKTEILIKRLGYQEIDEYERHICFGSFSLCWIVQRTGVFARDLEYYGFSSLISAMTPGGKIDIENKNPFRIGQVSQDILGTFRNTMERIHERAILFLDFMEERNPVFMWESNQYITESEAYVDSSMKDIFIQKRIQSGTSEFLHLWKGKCQMLVSLLASKKDMLKVVLIQNRMSFKYGDFNEVKEFAGKEHLEQVNAMLSGLEDYFLEQCKQNGISVTVYELPDVYCFTDKQFRYGCEPQYMNDALYTHLGFEIFKQLEEGKMK